MYPYTYVVRPDAEIHNQFSIWRVPNSPKIPDDEILKSLNKKQADALAQLLLSEAIMGYHCGEIQVKAEIRRRLGLEQ